MELTTEKRDWYLVQGASKRQWFDATPLHAVLSMAIIMTGTGVLSGADEVTLEDGERKPIVTFIANEDHAGCRMIIPVGSETTEEDLEELEQFMIEHELISAGELNDPT